MGEEVGDLLGSASPAAGKHEEILLSLTMGRKRTATRATILEGRCLPNEMMTRL
jgi:hypothetical protein